MTSSIGTMTVPNTPWQTASRAVQVLTSVLLLAGCTGLSAPQVASQTIYVLEVQRATKPAQVKRNLVLAIGEPQTRPGFDTPQMAYVQQPHELNYFVTSRWADTPARMLEPLLVQAMEQTGSFRAVVQTPGAVPADLRLDTELIRLQHDFVTRPSRVQLTLRAQLIDVRGQRVLAVKQFDESENAASDNAYGGVTAANRALQRMLDQLADFSVSASVIQ
ncbi:MAG TPA: ABC-type transport auxiliary lipoprotein family protein [Acidiferrobacterales bacterium]|nr:ABC-type transport auxiliary lipoprotein family protein [Acidiferrobacterales bacterium]